MASRITVRLTLNSCVICASLGRRVPGG